jgi:hypothetical protein
MGEIMGYINLPVEGGGSGNDPRVRIFKTSADVVGTTGVDQTVSDLSCVLSANKTYFIEVFVRLSTVNVAVASITHRPTYTGSINTLYATVGGAAVSNQNITSQPPASATSLGASLTANNSDFAPGMCFISVTAGGADTTFTYAFRSGNATSTTVRANSHMRVTEIG